MIYQKDAAINEVCEIFRYMCKHRDVETLKFRVKKNVMIISMRTFSGELFMKGISLTDFLSMSVLQMRTFINQYF